jgi:hypothetical protein
LHFFFQIGLGDSGYEADDEVSVGYDGNDDGEQQEAQDGDVNEQIPIEVSSVAHRVDNCNHLLGGF